MYGRWSFCPASACRISGAGDVDRDREADAAGILGNRRVDPDHGAGGVQEWPAAVARVDRGVGLDQVVERASVGLDLAADRGHDAARHAVRERPERASDRDDQLADLERVRVAHRGRRQPGRVDLHDRQIGQRVDPVDRAVVLGPVLQLDAEGVRAGDDVPVGEDPAVRVEDDPGADALGLGRVDAVGIDALGRDPDDRRAGRGGHVDDADDSSSASG
jgi:hypothetical protein